MTAASGALVVVRGTTKTLEANGSSISNNSIGTANDANYDSTTDGDDYPDAEFVISLTFGTQPAEGTLVSIYAQPLDVDGTGDTEVPETTRPTLFIASFAVNNVTTTQYSPALIARNVPKLATYYLHNNGTGQSISSGWTLKVTPRSVKAAP